MKNYKFFIFIFKWKLYHIIVISFSISKDFFLEISFYFNVGLLQSKNSDSSVASSINVESLYLSFYL